jgi:uncharacterized protein (TIGR02118 family)
MAYQLTVLYHHPDDAEEFNRYYDETHIPMAAKLPGLRGFSVSRPSRGPDGTRPPCHQIAVLTWDSEGEFQAAVGSAEGQAAMADVANFATGGAELVTGPTTVVV